MRGTDGAGWRGGTITNKNQSYLILSGGAAPSNDYCQFVKVPPDGRPAPPSLVRRRRRRGAGHAGGTQPLAALRGRRHAVLGRPGRDLVPAGLRRVGTGPALHRRRRRQGLRPRRAGRLAVGADAVRDLAAPPAQRARPHRRQRLPAAGRRLPAAVPGRRPLRLPRHDARRQPGAPPHRPDRLAHLQLGRGTAGRIRAARRQAAGRPAAGAAAQPLADRRQARHAGRDPQPHLLQVAPRRHHRQPPRHALRAAARAARTTGFRMRKRRASRRTRGVHVCLPDVTSPGGHSPLTSHSPPRPGSPAPPLPAAIAAARGWSAGR